MTHIKVNFEERLYWLGSNETIDGVVSIDLDRDNHTVKVYDSVGQFKVYDTKFIGVCTQNRDCPIEEFDFLDEF